MSGAYGRGNRDWHWKHDENKPMGAADGDWGIEKDTGDIYIFDGETWNKMCTIKEED